MKLARVLIPAGIALVAFGIIFQYQGRGVLGPESSFMYYNKDWIDYGIGIIACGIILVGIGIFAELRSRLRAA